MFAACIELFCMKDFLFSLRLSTHNLRGLKVSQSLSAVGPLGSVL